MKVTCEPKGIQMMSKGNKLANASITLDDAFVIRNLSVMNGPKGVFVSMPSQKGIDKDGNAKFYDTAFPLNGQLRAEINDAVINAYQQKLNELAHGAQTRSNGFDNNAQQTSQDTYEQIEDDQMDYGF